MILGIIGVVVAVVLCSSSVEGCIVSRARGEIVKKLTILGGDGIRALFDGGQGGGDGMRGCASAGRDGGQVSSLVGALCRAWASWPGGLHRHGWRARERACAQYHDFVR